MLGKLVCILARSKMEHLVVGRRVFLAKWQVCGSLQLNAFNLVLNAFGKAWVSSQHLEL